MSHSTGRSQIAYHDNSGSHNSHGNCKIDDFCIKCWKAFEIDATKYPTYSPTCDIQYICEQCALNFDRTTFPPPPEHIRAQLSNQWIDHRVLIQMCDYCKYRPVEAKLGVRRSEVLLCMECRFYVSKFAATKRHETKVYSSHIYYENVCS